MSETETTHTTARPPRHGRRDLLAGAAAVLGGVGLPVAAGAAPDADAGIVAVCARYVAAELEWRRRLSGGDEAGADALNDGERGEAMDAAVALPPAATLAGLRAKARAVVAFLDPDGPCESVFDATLWEVLTAFAGADLPAAIQARAA